MCQKGNCLFLTEQTSCKETIIIQLTIIIMFQPLLKTDKTKNSEKATENYDNYWDTPLANRYEKNQCSEEDQQTPSFLNKLNKISRKIQIAEENLQQGLQNEKNQKSSLIQYVDELIDQELHPMIISNINNPRPGLNKLIFLRLRNATFDLKQAYFDLTQYLEDQKKSIRDFHSKMSQELETFCQQFKIKTLTERDHAEINHLKTQNLILRQKLERKEAEFQRMNNEGINCGSCKQLQRKLAKLNEQLRKSEKEIQKFLIDNEQLQEHIFDIQQKIAGVDLEVQQKLKQKLTILQEYYNNRAGNSKEVQSLKEQINILELKCKKMEQQLTISAQVALTLEQLKQAQLQLSETQQKAQELKHANYERQQQILEAEQNLQKKINDIRNKQTDLSCWQAELTRKQADIRKMALQTKNQIEQTTSRNNQANQLKISRQISLKSFGRGPNDFPQNDFQLNLAPNPRHKTYQKQYQKSIIQEPRQYYEPNYDIGKRKIEPKSHIQFQNTGRDKSNNFINKPNLTRSNYRDARESSPYRTITEQRSRVAQYVGGRNTSQFRDISKNSRHSASKSMKNGYHPIGNHSKIHNEGNQLAGLGSKLQKLREQIKKQIQSIK